MQSEGTAHSRFGRLERIVLERAGNKDPDLQKIMGYRKDELKRWKKRFGNLENALTRFY